MSEMHFELPWDSPQLSEHSVSQIPEKEATRFLTKMLKQQQQQSTLSISSSEHILKEALT